MRSHRSQMIRCAWSDSQRACVLFLAFACPQRRHKVMVHTHAYDCDAGIELKRRVCPFFLNSIQVWECNAINFGPPQYSEIGLPLERLILYMLRL